MASQQHSGSGGSSVSVPQQNAQGQQLQLQQPTTTATIQGAHQSGNPNQMQSLQVIQQPLQNQLMQHQFYNTQGQLLMPGNIAFHPGLNPQLQQAQITPSIQVIAAGKTLQPNQISAPHMFTAATSYATIPTSASSNQAYIIGQLNSHPSLQLQQQQTSKPGEMQKVIQPQLGTTAQIPTQSIWAIPQFLNQNSILIRGTQPDQMFIQQQQPLHNTANSHQQFSTMPLTTGQLPPTSISSATSNGVHVSQQAQMQQAQNQQQSQAQQNQQQAQSQITTSNLVSIKSPAALQPKPPLQIQPQPVQPQNSVQNQQVQQQQNQQLQQQQTHQLPQLQVSMAPQSQMQLLPQVTTSQANMLQHQILAQNTQAVSALQVMQAQQQAASRQLTILPQGTTAQIQSQPVTLIQQQQQSAVQPQPIRPNYSSASTTTTTQSQGITTTATPTQRAKIRKPGLGRGSAASSPTQQGKAMFPRSTIPTNIAPLSAPQLKPAPPAQQTVGGTLKVALPQQGSSSSPVNQPLKTINIAALHTTTPNLPDATLTPLIPQGMTQTQIQQQTQPVHVFPTATSLPSLNISITPTQVPTKKEETPNDNSNMHTPNSQHSYQNLNNPQQMESKSENEKENTKSESNGDDPEEGSGKSKLPKALVKPQVLTHVIEGFVIQEASEPFPLGRNGDADEPPFKKVALSGEMGKCEMCGKVDLRSKFKKKRFCSSQCAKGMKNQQQSTTSPSVNNLNDAKSKGKKAIEGDSDETSSSGDASLSPSNDFAEDEPRANPMKWNVSEVVDFVRSLPGCAEYADDFAVQEIDGQALMLLKEDHLMSAMGMKLGPALKLCAKIEVIKSGMNIVSSEGSQGKS